MKSQWKWIDFFCHYSTIDQWFLSVKIAVNKKSSVFSSWSSSASKSQRNKEKTKHLLWIIWQKRTTEKKISLFNSILIDHWLVDWLIIFNVQKKKKFFWLDSCMIIILIVVISSSSSSLSITNWFKTKKNLNFSLFFWEYFRENFPFFFEK